MWIFSSLPTKPKTLTTVPYEVNWGKVHCNFSRTKKKNNCPDPLDVNPRSMETIIRSKRVRFEPSL